MSVPNPDRPVCRTEGCESRSAVAWCHVHRRAYRESKSPQNGLPVTEPFGDEMVEVVWSTEGMRHRLDGPALVVRRMDGVPYLLWWFRDGHEHRIDGPSCVQYGLDGEVVSTSWAFWGQPVDGPAGIGKRLSEGFEEEQTLAAEIDLSDYGVLLDEGITIEQIVAALCGGVTTLDGIREVVAGAPAEWVASFEAG